MLMNVEAAMLRDALASLGLLSMRAERLAPLIALSLKAARFRRI
jgi:hypothetical protein